MLSLTDFDYQLPDDRIAQVPMTPRDHSKLLQVDRRTEKLTDHLFKDLSSLLTPNDVLVVNDTKVIPARILATKDNGKPVEILLEKELSLTSDSITWEALTKPGIAAGQTLSIPHTPCRIVCEEVLGYTRKLRFSIDREHFYTMLDTWAKTPIPPYIRWTSGDEQALRERYQTVYATYAGAVAAPTAGLHFTPELLRTLTKRGIQIERVTLHVGLGTFLPVKSDDITHHVMHKERYTLSQPTATTLNEAKQAGKRIIAVGTTTVRVLETCARKNDNQVYLEEGTGATDIFIYPPYQFQFVDSLITNFHTPKSTLLMLVSALVSAPQQQEGHTLPPFSSFKTSFMGQAYQHALDHNYRFYSFGDAMWIS